MKEEKKGRVIVNRNPRGVSFVEAKTMLRTLKPLVEPAIYDAYCGFAMLVYSTTREKMEEN